MSHFLNFRATNDVMVSVNGLVVQSPFEIKNNDVITIKAKTNVTLNINGTSYTSAQTIALSETNITVTYSTTGDEQSTYYVLTINYSDEVLSGLKGFLKNKDNKVLFPYAYGLKNPDGSDRPLGGVGVDLTYATFDEDGNFAITPQQLAVLNADANNYITITTYVYRSVVDPKQGDTMYYVSTLANPDKDGSFIFLTITINKNTLMAKYGHSVINLDEIGGDYISITANNGVTSGNITQSQLKLLQKSVNNTIFLNEEKYYLMDKETTENYLVYGCVVKNNTNTTWIKTITISKTNLGWSLTTLSLIGKTDFDNALLKTKQATKTSEMTNEIGVDSNGKLWTSGGSKMSNLTSVSYTLDTTAPGYKKYTATITSLQQTAVAQTDTIQIMTPDSDILILSNLGGGKFVGTYIISDDTIQTVQWANVATNVTLEFIEMPYSGAGFVLDDVVTQSGETVQIV